MQGLGALKPVKGGNLYHVEEGGTHVTFTVGEKQNTNMLIATTNLVKMEVSMGGGIACIYSRIFVVRAPYAF